VRSSKQKLKVGIGAVTAICSLAGAPVALAQTSGGTASSDGSAPPPSSTTTTTSDPGACTVGSGGVGQTDSTCAPVKRAKLVGGQAIAPSSAPPRVAAVIQAANKIATKPYIWGGGHGRWWDKGYDCSGAVSYALHGGTFLTAPMDSSDLMHWGSPGLGRWITVYTNAGHAYAVIAGLRWDTSGDASGTGPRWHKDLRNNVGYKVRHPYGY
jgi:cell wall-associated NlpC family hydrolase